MFGNTRPLIEIDKSGSIIIPKNVSFDAATPTLNFDKADEKNNIVASLDYSFNNHYVGYTTLNLIKSSEEGFEFSANSSSIKDGESVAIDTDSNTISIEKNKNDKQFQTIKSIMKYKEKEIPGFRGSRGRFLRRLFR